MIYLVFIDDWELRGDGSGDIERIQFAPMRRLLEIFEKHGVRCTLMAETMQQLTFRARQDEYPELKPLADEWDEHVRDAYGRGHDVQLHVHTQWSDAVFKNGKWNLRGSWSLLNYPPEDAARMIADGRIYLEELLRPIAEDYKCVAFRASYLAAAPSPTLLGELAKQGIELEASLVGGLKVNTSDVRIDYTDCDEDFQCFYPQMSDARRLSSKREPIVCTPIFHFIGSRRSAVTEIVAKVRKKLRSPDSSGKYTPLETSSGRYSMLSVIYQKAVRPLLRGKYHTADISKLDYGLLREMLATIRSRASAVGLARVPVVITNHSKYMSDFDGFERFLKHVAEADDLRTITMSQLASMIRKGEFEVRTA